MIHNKSHGNRLRPPDEAYERKKQLSRETYKKAMLAINPFWLNEKILRKNYNLYGSDPLEMDFLYKQGFNFKLLNKKLTIKDNIVFCMNKFGYYINHNEKIIIWKTY